MPIQSVERAVRILGAFSVERPLLGITELSAMVELNQSTVHHLVRSLLRSGLIEQDPISRKYRLGLRLIELAGTMLHSRNLAQLIQPYLHHVADVLAETSYLGVMHEGDVINVEQVCGPHMIQYVGWQGRRTPFHCTSSGKALVAYLPTDALEHLIAYKGLARFTANTITDPSELKRHLAKVREQGYAINIGELEDHNNAIAVPIWAQNGDRVAAALGVVGPSYRFKETNCHEAAPFLKSVAQEISSVVHVDDLASLPSLEAALGL
jgi:DNA-binding IclR family transcriptional regulator